MKRKRGVLEIEIRLEMEGEEVVGVFEGRGMNWERKERKRTLKV